MDVDSITARLSALREQIAEAYPRHIGFPAAKDFDYQELYPFFGYMLNNIGDPYEIGLNAQHSKEMEREVIGFFADLFRAPKNNRWGYVDNGSTEGNLYALWIARELHPGARVYFSADAHYSMAKNTHLLAMPASIVKSQKHGEMDYDDLQAQLTNHKDQPAIIVAAIGTTMTEARDNVATIRIVLAKAGIKEYHIHADAAMAGPYSALLNPHHPFDFEDGADSIAISGCKFVGTPMPCGVVIIRKHLRDKVSRLANYTGTTDTTISGSRSGQAPIILWYAIQKWGREGLKKRAEASLAMAEYTQKKLNDMGWKAWRNPQAMTVVLQEPPKAIVKKWQLGTHHGWCHIICEPGVLKKDIDNFLSDLNEAIQPLVKQPAHE